MTAARRRDWAPWITAAVAGAVLVALLVVYFVVLLPYRADHPAGALTSSELDAMESATVELNNVGALAGKGNFDVNYNHALAGATGPFKQDLVSERAQAKKALAGKGVTAQVTHRALIGPTDSGPQGYILLMTLAGPSSNIGSLLLAPQQVTVTVVDQNGKWLVSDIRSAGITQ